MLAFSYCRFFFNDTATTEIYTLSLHDALPISCPTRMHALAFCGRCRRWDRRSEEHTSELQSRQYLVCRLLLEKKKTKKTKNNLKRNKKAQSTQISSRFAAVSKRLSTRWNGDRH